MATGVMTPDELAVAQVGASAYGLMAHGFRYPDSEWLTVLMDPRRWKVWPDTLPGACPEVAKRFRALQASAGQMNAPAALEDLQEQYALLFGHSVRGMCPPYELEFGKSEVIQRASDLADINGFFSAFGMELAGDISERPDHISVEAEFMAVLCLKEIAGGTHQNHELIETVRHAQTEFLKAHLGRWVPAFARRVMASSNDGFYGILARFADAWVERDCARLSISSGSPYLELRPVDPVQEGTQSCGVPTECGTNAPPELTQLNVAIGNDS